MFNHTLILWIVLLSSTSFADINCDQLNEDEYELEVVKEKQVLTEKIWNKMDVLGSLKWESCEEHVSQEIVKIEGENYWHFKTTADKCDGGAASGAIYTKDLKTPVVHIYDGSYYCPEHWFMEEKAVNHFPVLICNSAKNISGWNNKGATFNKLRYTAYIESNTSIRRAVIGGAYSTNMADLTAIESGNDSQPHARFESLKYANCNFDFIAPNELSEQKSNFKAKVEYKCKNWSRKKSAKLNCFIK